MAARSASSFEDYPRMPLTLLPSEQERAVVAVTMISLEMWGSDSFQLWLKNKGIPLHATHGVHSPDSHLAGPRRHLRCGIKSSPSPPNSLLSQTQCWGQSTAERPAGHVSCWWPAPHVSRTSYSFFTNSIECSIFLNLAFLRHLRGEFSISFDFIVSFIHSCCLSF